MKFCLVKEKMLKIFIKKFKKLCLGDDIIKKRIEWIDVFKGFAIIMVVYGHILFNNKIVNLLYTIHLPMFMFISGYLFKKENINVNVKRKAKKIIIPYLFFSIIELIYFILIESKFRSIKLTPLQCVVGILFGYYDYLEFNVHLWYLPFFYFVIVVYNFLQNKISVKVSRIIFIVLGIIYPFIKIINLPFSCNRFDLMLYFAIGNFYYDNKGKITIFNHSKLFNFVIGTIIIVFVYISYSYFNKIGLYYIGGLLSIFAFMIFSKLIEKKDIILKKVGKISLLILCIHGPIYRVFIKLMSTFLNCSSDQIRKNFFYVTIIVILTLIVCNLIYIVLKKINPILVGEKKQKV